MNKRIKVEIVKPEWRGLTLAEVRAAIESVNGLSQTYDPVLQFALYEFASELEELLMEKNG
jgi:hypothetical protein